MKSQNNRTNHNQSTPTQQEQQGDTIKQLSSNNPKIGNHRRDPNNGQFIGKNQQGSNDCSSSLSQHKQDSTQSSKTNKQHDS